MVPLDELMGDIDFTPEDRPPDPDFLEVGRQARLAAHYHLTLKEQGLCEYEAAELSKEWLSHLFVPDDPD